MFDAKIAGLSVDDVSAESEVESRLREIASKDEPTEQELEWFDAHASLPWSYYDERTPEDGGDY